jgi:hypothetical protein
MGLTLNRTATESGEIYATALSEACEKAGGADPVKVLTDTDDYPQVVKHVDMAEYIVGWFWGVAESLGVLPETLWEKLAPKPAPKKTKKRKAKKTRKGAKK